MAYDAEFKKAAGARLKMAREAFCLRRGELGEMVGRNRGIVSRWEKGIELPQIDELAPFCERYGVTLDFIFYGKIDRLPHDLAVKILKDDPGLRP